MTGFDSQAGKAVDKAADRGPSTWARISGTLAAVGFAVVLAGPAEAVTRTERTFDGWTVSCVDDDEQQKRCTMYQSQVRAQDRQLVLAWAISRNQDNELVQTVTVPSGVSIKEGIRLFIGDADPVTLGYDICGPRVCFARVPLTDDLVVAVRSSSRVSASYVRGNKQLMQLDLDVDGFADAYDYFVSELSS
ncbi:invasion associated locus B family protein [Bauldia sp.]|uniref:invasion associated locus B family protein n=1 Tax=Bauldia sp. TaxID=2575872 RepID=UPI003BACA598